MVDTWKALLASRKFWVGTITVSAIAAAVVLVALGKLPSTELTATMTAIAAVGMSVIGSIAWEDSAEKRNAGGNVARIAMVHSEALTEAKREEAEKKPS